jgi:hypothetical protein
VVEPISINAFWTVPVASAIGIAVGTNPLHGHSLDNPHFDSTSTVTVTVKDQYGNAIAKASPGYGVTLSFLRGNGSLTGEGATFTEASGPQTFYSTGGVLSFTYARRGTWEGSPPEYTGNGEKSPLFTASISAPFNITGMSTILQLQDDSGNQL